MEYKGKYTYMVELGETKKVFVCPPTQLKDKVKEEFKIQESFQLQVHVDDFGEWADVTDFETLPSTCKVKVKTGEKIFRAIVHAFRAIIIHSLKCSADCIAGFVLLFIRCRCSD